MAKPGPPAVAAALNPPLSQGEARLRQGVVQASPVPTADTVYVKIQDGSGVFPLPYPAGYVPLADDVVYVLSIGSGATETGIVVMAAAGRSGNRVLNPSFDTVADLGTVPDNWNHYAAIGTIIVISGGNFDLNETPSLVMVSGAAASDSYESSAAIPVTPGEQYELAYIVRMQTGNPNPAASLLAMWFASATDLYPATVAADTTASSDTLTGPAADNAAGSGIVTVPDGATHMRVGVRIQQGAGAGFALSITHVSAYKI